MNKCRGFFSILIPGLTVFVSSFCIMVLELVAARLIAKHLGSSLYTWTAVIGVVLAGITIGNYLGGRIADRFKARKALAMIFAISSGACIITVVLNNLVGEWVWLWHFSWPVRTFTHVALVFLLPSVLLGTISPVVAKMALDRGLPTGRTVGDIYACGAAGSIAGTFAAGYYLIAAMGTVAIIWTVGAALLLISILYWVRLPFLYAWAVIFSAFAVMGMGPSKWAQKAGGAISLRGQPDPQIIYEDESQYCHIAVKRISENPDKRLFMQDKLKHSEILINDPYNLQYFYTVIFGAVAHGAAGQEKGNLSVMHIGGGGYVFPRYIEKNWPGSRNDVVEIDTRVTEAARQAFGLEKETTINIITMDARNYVEGLLLQQRTGGPVTRYDLIIEDAFNDYSVPYQLVTKEFNDKISRILTDDGVYVANLVDSYETGWFIGAYLNTLQQTFPHVYVVGQDGPVPGRQTFVLIAGKRQMDIAKFVRDYRKELRFWCPNDLEIETLRRKSRGILLTDDYVPVENMLAPVVRISAVDFLSARLREQAQELERQGKLEQAIAKFEEIIKVNPRMSIMAYHGTAFIQFKQGKAEAAAQSFKKAIEYNEKSDFKENMANIHVSLGTVLNQLNRTAEASEHFNKAIALYREELRANPESLKTWMLLGDTLGSAGDFEQTAECFRKAVELDASILDNHTKLVQALELQGRYDEAITALKRAIVVAAGQEQAAAQMRKYLELLEFRKARQPK